MRTALAPLVATAALLLVACDPTAPTATFRWTELGLADEEITALAATPWGVFAGTRANGVFRLVSDTGGWETLGLDHAVVSDLVFAATDPPMLLAGVRPESSEVTAAALFASFDRGQTWVPRDGGLAQQKDQRFWAYSVAVDAGDPATLFFGEEFAVVRSRDAGVTWEVVHGPFAGGGTKPMVVDPSGSGRVVATARNALSRHVMLRSLDDGDTWEEVPDRFFLDAAFDPAVPGRLWAASGAVWYTDDAGLTLDMSLPRSQEVSATELVFVSDELFAVGHRGGRLAVLRRRSLTEWEDVAVPAEAGLARAAAADDAGRLYIGTKTTGVWRAEP